MRLHRWIKPKPDAEPECASCGIRVSWPGAIRRCSGRPLSDEQFHGLVARSGWSAPTFDDLELRACLSSATVSEPMYRISLNHASGLFANHMIRGRTGVW